MQDFIDSRTPFIIRNGTLHFASSNMKKTCKAWATSNGLSAEDWANSIRGYIIEGRVQFFTGKNYREVPFNQLLRKYVMAAVDKHMSMFPGSSVHVYNGVKVGESGEVWEPISEVCI